MVIWNTGSYARGGLFDVELVYARIYVKIQIKMRIEYYEIEGQTIHR